MEVIIDDRVVLDMEGIERDVDHVIIVTKEDFESWSSGVEVVDGIDISSVIGPGTYYFAGRGYNDGSSVWKPVIKLYDMEELFVEDTLTLREIDWIYNVSISVHDMMGNVILVQPLFYHRRGELMIACRGGRLTVPDCSPGQYVSLDYTLTGNRQKGVMLVDKLSTEESEWIRNAIDSEYVLESLYSDSDKYINYES